MTHSRAHPSLARLAGQLAFALALVALVGRVIQLAGEPLPMSAIGHAGTLLPPFHETADRVPSRPLAPAVPRIRYPVTLRGQSGDRIGVEDDPAR